MYKFAYDNRDGAKKLWRIGIINGYASVEVCELPTSFPTQSKITWSKVLDVGEAVDVDIVFDARWYKDDEKQKWIMNAIDNPWFFWVDSTGNLYSKHWMDSPIVLAEGVQQLSAIRAWKNVAYWNDDQGIVVAYLKNCSVYYRNYCLQPPSSEQVWETERLVPNLPSTCDYIHAFRTNDYRTGIQAISNGKTYWTVSERDWAGMSIPIERITVAPASVSITFTQIEYPVGYAPAEYITASPITTVRLGYALTDNMFTEIYNQPIMVDGMEDWGKELIIKTEHDLNSINPSDFEIVDAYNRLYYPNTIEEIGSLTYKLNFTDLNNFNNVDKVGTLRFKGLYTTNYIGLLYEPFEAVFHPKNLVPTFIPLPEVESIWNE